MESGIRLVVNGRAFKPWEFADTIVNGHHFVDDLKGAACLRSLSAGVCESTKWNSGISLTSVPTRFLFGEDLRAGLQAWMFGELWGKVVTMTRTLIVCIFMAVAFGGPQPAAPYSAVAVSPDSTAATTARDDVGPEGQLASVGILDSVAFNVTQATTDSTESRGTWSSRLHAVNGIAGPIANWIVIASPFVALGAWWWRRHTLDLPTEDECRALDSFQRARDFAAKEDDNGLIKMMLGLQEWILLSDNSVPEVTNELRRIDEISVLLNNPLYDDKEIDRSKERHRIIRLANQALRKLKRRVKTQRTRLMVHRA